MLSANTLFHFTKDIEILSKILINGFRPAYSKENFSYLKENTPFNIYHVPMVCFCDIPLSQVKNHTDKFGKFGLGMSIEWAVEKGISPVNYIPAGTSNPYFAISGMEQMALITSPQNADFPSHESLPLQMFLANIILILDYIKPYMTIDKTSGLMNKCYDEKEWRYLAEFSCFPQRNPHFLRIPEFSAISKPEELSFYKDIYESSFGMPIETAIEQGKKLISNKYLKFKPNDIKYIIVRHESNIFELRDKLLESNKFTEDEVEKIISKKITYNQIQEDF